MKNSILSSVVRATLLACIFLSSVPLFGMQLNALDNDSSDETESVSEEQESEQTSGSGVRAFLASQVAGARELLGYGKHAAEDLVALMTQSNSLNTQKNKNVVETSAVMDTLVKCFLNDEEKYQEHIKYWSKDIRTLFARYILLNHPLVKVIHDRMGKYLCKKTFHPGFFVDLSCKPGFNVGGDKVVFGCKRRGTVVIWDLAEEKCLHELRGHNTDVALVQFNAKGDKVATSTRDDITKIWDVETGECLQVFAGRSVRFNHVGDKIVTASEDRTIKIWDVESGACLQILEGHVYPVLSAAFNRAGDKIVSIAEDTAKIWDLNTHTCLHTLDVNKLNPRNWYPLSPVQFNLSGDKIITTSSRDKTAKIWDTLSGNCLHTLSGHQAHVYIAVFSRYGDKILTASMDRTIKIWDVNTGECMLTLEHNATVTCAAFNGREDRVVTVGAASAPQIWNAKTGRLLCSLKGHTKEHVAVARFNGSGDTVVTISWAGAAKLWDVTRLEAITNWLEKECTLEQALLLNCIYEARIAHALLKKRKSWFYRPSRLRFDFDKCPHLQEHFDTMPPEVQACLEPFIKRCSSFRSRGRLPS